ncbi:hypothetical protein ACH4NT_03865 [Streptomyces lydicus]|uniref:hypothetical protein n=1 Tax=Streptomyces lydicus TaxID=47763 RepID=UPI0037B9346B
MIDWARTSLPPSLPKAGRLTYDDIASVRNDSLADDLRTTVTSVLSLTGRAPLVADMNRYTFVGPSLPDAPTCPRRTSSPSSPGNGGSPPTHG